ncbi:MAG: hypothetical protein ACSHYF_14200 [Verrucomicrobiaceae bacterium]
MNSDSPYIGLTKEAAMLRAKKEGKRARVVSEDGRQSMVTKDYRPDRLNFTIEAGKVTRVQGG